MPKSFALLKSQRSDPLEFPGSTSDWTAPVVVDMVNPGAKLPLLVQRDWAAEYRLARKDFQCLFGVAS